MAGGLLAKLARSSKRGQQSADQYIGGEVSGIMRQLPWLPTIPGERLMSVFSSLRFVSRRMTQHMLTSVLLIIAIGLAACDHGGGQTTGPIFLPPKKTITNQASIQEYS